MGNGQSTSSGTKVLAKVARGDVRAAQQVRGSTTRSRVDCLTDNAGACAFAVSVLRHLSFPQLHTTTCTRIARLQIFSVSFAKVEEARAGYFHTSKGRRAALAVAAGNNTLHWRVPKPLICLSPVHNESA